jgi:cob(I)alamin adenosyltransferase
MKIYTRTGDDGQTSLFAGGRTSKNSARLHAYGTIDELNSFVGLVLAQGVSPELTEALNAIQNELFIVGSDLATPLDAEAAWISRVSEEQVTRLEHEIDQMDAQLAPLKNFILPGGTVAASSLHIARTVCRRAERWIVELGVEENLNASVLHYVNRLSDWLFVAARYENYLSGKDETIWQSPNR